MCMLCILLMNSQLFRRSIGIGRPETMLPSKPSAVCNSFLLEKSFYWNSHKVIPIEDSYKVEQTAKCQWMKF